MESLLSYIENYQPKIQYAQIAFDRNWEDAMRLEINDCIRANTFPKNIDESVAGEIFYKLSNGKNILLGLRYSPKLQSISSPNEFLQKFQESLQISGSSSVRETLSLLGETLNGDPTTYTTSQVNYVELGITDYWKSTGSIVLRKKNEPLLATESLINLLEKNKKLTSNSKNYTALDFAIDSPQHWLAIQVSSERNGQHTTDIDLLLELVNMI